ncbi:MAG: hypothetical protein ACE1ZT_04710, partial [Dehalococcoidia bacterium]
MYGIRIPALLLVMGAIAAACAGDVSNPTPTPTPTLAPTPASTAIPTEATPTSPSTEEPPDRDLIDLARRFRGLPPDTPRIARQSPFNYSVGDSEEFSILDLNGPSLRTVTASVRAVTQRAYFFVEDGIGVDASALETIGSDFETLVYPRVTAAFGRERSPGVDGDARISIVHANLSGAGGYVSSSDAYPRSAVPRSNEREAIYLDAS